MNDDEAKLVKELFREWGRKGGLARAASLGKAAMSRIGRAAAKARWKGQRKKRKP